MMSTATEQYKAVALDCIRSHRCTFDANPAVAGLHFFMNSGPCNLIACVICSISHSFHTFWIQMLWRFSPTEWHQGGPPFCSSSSFQNYLAWDMTKKWTRFPFCGPHFLKHLSELVGVHFAVICGVQKSLVITFHLNSLQLLELVIKCASRQTSSYVSVFTSASHFSFICEVLFGLIERKIKCHFSDFFQLAVM